MLRWKILNGVLLAVGAMALVSVLVYATTGLFWWARVNMGEIERSFAIFMLHVGSIVSGGISLAWWLHQAPSTK